MNDINNRYSKYLTLPGCGVHTVHTAKEHREDILRYYFQTTDLDEAKNLWLKKLDEVKNNEKPILLGICSDCGGGIQRGANWGPLFIRKAAKQSLSRVFDIGDIRVIPHLLHDKYLNEATIKECQQALYNGDPLPVSPLSISEDFCETLWTSIPEAKLISLGGDHSVSYPLVKKWLQKNMRANVKSAVIHFDAHTDLLDKRLGIDLCFGSWAYHIIPYLEDPSHLVQFGIRSTAKERSHWESTLGVQQMWPNELEKFIQVATDISQKLKQQGIEQIYISCDIDALDSKYASATGTPESHGLEPHQIIAISEVFMKDFKVTGADLVEVAPFVSFGESHSPEPHTTLQSSKIILDCFIEGMS